MDLVLKQKYLIQKQSRIIIIIQYKLTDLVLKQK